MNRSPFSVVKYGDRMFEIQDADGYTVAQLAPISKKLAEVVAGAVDWAYRTGRTDAGEQTPIAQVAETGRASAPHCDQTILHAPGKCEHCDKYPDWQAYRKVAQIAFSGESNERGVIRRNALDFPYEPGIAPCPSTWFRDPAVRDRWFGNRPDAGSAEAALGDQPRIDWEHSPLNVGVGPSILEHMVAPLREQERGLAAAVRRLLQRGRR